MMRSRRFYMVLAGTLCVSLCGWCAQRKEPTPQVLAKLSAGVSEEIEISGVVLDSATRKPVAGARVILGGDWPRAGAVDAEDGAREQFSLANGSFRFSHVALKYSSESLWVQKSGYEGGGRGDNLRSVALEVDPEMGPLTIWLTPAVTITGQVRTAAGTALAHVPLYLYRQEVYDGRHVWREVAESLVPSVTTPQALANSAVTDGQGRYSFTNLRPGTYLVETGLVLDSDPEAVEPQGRLWADRALPDGGYAPSLSPGVHELSAARLLALAPGAHGVANFTLAHQEFHAVTITLVGKVKSQGSMEVEDAHRQKLMLPVPTRTRSIRYIADRYEAARQQYLLHLPDGSYTAIIRGITVPEDPYYRNEGDQPQFYDTAAMFTVAGHSVDVSVAARRPEQDKLIPVKMVREFTTMDAVTGAPRPCESTSRGAGAILLGKPAPVKSPRSDEKKYGRPVRMGSNKVRDSRRSSKGPSCGVLTDRWRSRLCRRDATGCTCGRLKEPTSRARRQAA